MESINFSGKLTERFSEAVIIMVLALLIAAAGTLSYSYAVSGTYKDQHDNDVHYTLDTDTGELKVFLSNPPSENGAILEFNKGEAPWDSYRDAIRSVEIKDIKWLGGSTFRGCLNLEKAVIEGAAMEMTDFFFADCLKLAEVELKTGAKMYILQKQYDPDEEEDPYKDYEWEFGPFSGCDIDNLNIITDPDSDAASSAKRRGLKVNGKWSMLSQYTQFGDPDKYILSEEAFGTLFFTEYNWTGKAIKPVPEIKIRDKYLTYGTDYIVSYKNNKNMGEARCIVEGIGDFCDSTFMYFRINPKGTSVKKVSSPAKKKLKVTWKRQSTKMSKSRIDGYQVQIAADKAFSKKVRSFWVKGHKSTSKTIKGLKSGKKYFVRIRTVRSTNKYDIASKWCSAKSHKVK